MWVVILLIVVIYFYRKNRKNDKIYRVWDTYESRYSVCQDFELDQKKYTRSSTTQRGPITYVNENGYLCFISSDYPVHRWLAAKKIGRKLKKGQVVHHMDRNKLNNEAENLWVFKSQREHDYIHKVDAKRYGFNYSYRGGKKVIQ